MSPAFKTVRMGFRVSQHEFANPAAAFSTVARRSAATPPRSGGLLFPENQIGNPAAAGVPSGRVCRAGLCPATTHHHSPTRRGASSVPGGNLDGTLRLPEHQIDDPAAAGVRAGAAAVVQHVLV